MTKEISNEQNPVDIRCHSCDRLVRADMMSIAHVVLTHEGRIKIASSAEGIEDPPEIKEVLHPTLMCFQCYSNAFLNEE